MEERIVYFQCKDAGSSPEGTTLVQLPFNACYLSGLLSSLFEDLGDCATSKETPVIIPDAYPAATVRHVVDWMVHAREFITQQQVLDSRKAVYEAGKLMSEERDYLTPTPWEIEWCQGVKRNVKDMALALMLANYLELPFLMDLIGVHISEPIRYLRPEDMCQAFHLVQPLTDQYIEKFVAV